MGQESGVGSQESGDGGTATANDTFRIDRLTLKNFRCFEERTIDFHPRFNVLIGDNGTGKTAVCDALAHWFGWALDRLGVGHGDPGLGLDDIRRRPTETEGLASVEAADGMQFGVEMLDAHGATELSLTYDASAGPSDPGWRLIEQFTPKDGCALRLVAYYGASRFAQQSRIDAADFPEEQPRINGYMDCLVATSTDRHMLRWVKAAQAIEDQERRGLPAFAMLKHVLAACTPDYRDLKFLFRSNALRFRLSSQPPLDYSMLSHGVRGIVALVADLAWRSSVLNPHLGADAARETPGIVLIDEIDLHLHPKWQRHVVDDLKRAFPKVQFIVTTHSPVIVQSLQPGELIKLDGEVRDEYADKSVEDVLEAAMGVDEPYRSERYQRMAQAAKAYHRLLRRGEGANADERERLKRELDELIAPFSDNVAYYAFLEAEREAAGLGGGSE